MTVDADLRDSALRALKAEWLLVGREGARVRSEIMAKLQLEEMNLGRSILHSIAAMVIRMGQIQAMLTPSTQPHSPMTMPGELDRMLAEQLDNG